MPAVGVNDGFWSGRRVFITGHTGFMGGWLSLSLARLGAEVHGYALAAPTNPSFFETTSLDADIVSTVADVRDFERLATALGTAKPEIVLHLAAQPLVRRAFANPVETYGTNVMGTVNLLEALRLTEGVRAAVIVTTDKVYENREWAWGYRESDTLGGREPYGNSKACAELIVSAFCRSYFSDRGGSDRRGKPGIATVRAGNIIGGGDWGEDRLVPDAMRAFANGETLNIRNPGAVRPWQHVLDPLRGFLNLAERLWDDPPRWTGAWNFGPDEEDARTVACIADKMTALWGNGARWQPVEGEGPYEARILTLSSVKAHAELGWRPTWNLHQAIARAVAWYRAFHGGGDMRDVTLAQINAFEKDAKSAEKHGKTATHGARVAKAVA